jgi:hypothetical protein
MTSLAVDQMINDIKNPSYNYECAAQGTEGGWAAGKRIEFWLYIMKKNRIARIIYEYIAWEARSLP